MSIERRRAPRYAFHALAEIVDENENARSSSRISDLSLHGCYVEMANPFPEGTSVMIEISTDEDSLEAQATVAHFEPKRGMGLTFGELPESLAHVLNKWVAQAKKGKPN